MPKADAAHFALGKSDAAAKADGTFKAAQVAARAAARKGRRAGAGEEEEAAEAGAKRAAASSDSSGSFGPGLFAAAAADAAPPNSTLFVTNLPETTTDAMLSMLFQQFPGSRGPGWCPAKPGIAFVEFETEVAAGVAERAARVQDHSREGDVRGVREAVNDDGAIDGLEG